MRVISMSNDIEIGLMEIQKEFESSIMTIILLLNQNGLNYEAITNLIEISVNNCLNKYEKNRDLLSIVFKKLNEEGGVYD